MMPGVPPSEALPAGRPPAACDALVVGGGIVGLATARELLMRRPGSSVVVLEREPGVGRHQTSHNSGVIHAGIYYTPGSLKARLCVDGARRLYALCDELGVRTERCGKLVIARAAHELPRLDELERRAAANGVRASRVAAEEIASIEPHARGVAALHSPDTGIVDFAAVALALARDLERRGGTIVTGCAVSAIGSAHGEALVRHARGTTRAGTVVACAGACSDRLAVSSGGRPEPRIVPFRGAYFRLRRPELVRALIYPVPDPALPFLGVHLTRRVQGDVVAGPTALPAAARDAYRLSTVRPRDLAQTLSWPGTYRMAWRWRRQALREIGYAASRGAYAREARGLVPALRRDDLVPAFAGVRAQALDRRGTLLDDFVFDVQGAVVHVRNAPSPAATAALAIASEIADRAAMPGRP